MAIGQKLNREGMSEAEANALVKDAEKACVNCISLSALFSLLLPDITFRFILVTLLTFHNTQPTLRDSVAVFLQFCSL